MWGDPTLSDCEELELFEYFPSDQQQQIQQQTKSEETVTYKIEGVSFEVLSNYKPKKFVGKGSFGIVW